MNMRDLIDLFEAPAQGATGTKLAQTSGGQFMNKADRLNQAKVDAALGPGFTAGTAAANMALAKKFSQPQPAGTAAVAPTISDRAATDINVAGVAKPAATDTNQAAQTVPADQSLDAGEEVVDNPATDTRGAAAMASKSAPTQTSDQTATAALNTAPAADANVDQEATAARDRLQAQVNSGAYKPVAQVNPQTAPAATNTATASKSDYQPVAGTTNVVSRTSDKIAADQKAGGLYGQQNQATKSYASFGDFASAVGDKVKGMFGGNQPTNNAATAMASKSAPTQTSDQAATAALNAAPEPATTTATKPAGGYGQFAEDELEEQDNMELEEMMRLSGLALNEKAVSKQQQKFMGMVHAMQKGEKVKGASPELKKAAKTMSKKDTKDFASTKHKGLPKKVNEDVMLDEGGNALKHIANRFKHEVKNFMNNGFMAENLYDALYDYYLDTGEMPYGVAKGREGDPYQWVEERFYADMGSSMSESVVTEQPVVDNTLSELARLAGLSESKLDECGDMGMNSHDTMNVSTNMSSNGTKSVNISAQGDKADELLSMLKLAGMNSSDRPAMVVMSDGDEEMMEADRETEYENTPEEEYQTVDSIIRQGNDLNREKRQYADKPKLGDNPMAESTLDADLDAMLESILIRDNKDDPEIKKDPETGRVRATFPPPKKSGAPDQSKLPLTTHSSDDRVGGPRHVTIGSGDEKEVDEGWDDVSNFVGDLVGTEASKLRTSQQLRDLDAMRKQYKGTEYEKQVNDRYDTHLNRLQADKGEVVGKDGEPIKVLPPQQWKGK
jgi:hypothetical protein